MHFLVAKCAILRKRAFQITFVVDILVEIMLCGRYLVDIWFIFVVVYIYYNPTGRSAFQKWAFTTVGHHQGGSKNQSIQIKKQIIFPGCICFLKMLRGYTVPFWATFLSFPMLHFSRFLSLFYNLQSQVTRIGVQLQQETPFSFKSFIKSKYIPILILPLQTSYQLLSEPKILERSLWQQLRTTQIDIKLFL